MAVCSIDRSLGRAMPDRDPDAPDPAPSGPLLPSAYWILFNSTSVFHRAALPFILSHVSSLVLLSKSTSVYYQVPLLVLLHIVSLVTSLWILSISTSDNHQIPSLVVLLVVHVPLVVVVHHVSCHWVLSDSTSVYRQPPSVVLLFTVLLVTSFWFLRARHSQFRQLPVPGRCRIPAWMFAVLLTGYSIYESIVLHSHVRRAFRTLQSQSQKLTVQMRELGCRELEPLMLARSNYVYRLREFTFTRFVIDQSLVVLKRVFRILQRQFRKLTVLVPVRMRELGCKFLDSWRLQADNYVRGLLEELRSRSNHTRISINIYIVLRSLLYGDFQALNEVRKLMTLWIGVLCIEGILLICNAFKVVIHMLSNDEDEVRKNEDSTLQQSSPIFILNEELRDAIFVRLDRYEISRSQIVCKAFRNLKQSSTLKSLRNTIEGLFGPSVFFLERTSSITSWQWISYNIISNRWERMPSFSSLPLPDEDLFKEYLIAGSNGLMCLDVGKGNHEALVLYQPLTREKKFLPPLIHRRRPVLIAIIYEYDDLKNTYKIIVAGSSTTGSEHLSQKTEVYDSRTSCWRESDDIPGPPFALNEYQTGVYVKNANTLFCTGFLPNNKGRGILAYNVIKEVWIKDMSCQLPYNIDPNEAGYEVQITNAQLIGYKNRVFLFSEQELGQEVTHSIHEFSQVEDCKIISDDGNRFNKAFFEWKRILSESRNGARGLLVYPEFECQVHGEDQFCIFNTIEQSGVLYTIHTNSGVPITSKQKLPPCPKLKENSLIIHSLNSLNFVFELSFKISL